MAFHLVFVLTLVWMLISELPLMLVYLSLSVATTPVRRIPKEALHADANLEQMRVTKSNYLPLHLSMLNI